MFEGFWYIAGKSVAVRAGRPLVATRCNPAIKTFYQRLCGVGKAKKVALTACMRKLLIILNAMLKHRPPWRPDLVQCA